MRSPLPSQAFQCLAPIWVHSLEASGCVSLQVVVCPWGEGGVLWEFKGSDHSMFSHFVLVVVHDMSSKVAACVTMPACCHAPCNNSDGFPYCFIFQDHTIVHSTIPHFPLNIPIYQSLLFFKFKVSCCMNCCFIYAFTLYITLYCFRMCYIWLCSGTLA